MKLNPDCVRDVLLALERHLGLESRITVLEIAELPEMKKYEADDVFYACKMLEDEKYIKSGPPKYYINMAPTKGDHIVQDITRDGHTFLDKIRDNKAWSIAKGLMKNAAPITFAAILDFLGQAATKMF